MLVNSGLDFEAPYSVQGNIGGRETMDLAAEGPPSAPDVLWPGEALSKWLAQC